MACDPVESLAAQRFAARRQRPRKVAVGDLRKPRRAHIDLAIHEFLLVAVRETFGGRHSVTRCLEMVDDPLRGIFAIGLFSRKQQAGIAEPADFLDKTAFGRVGFVGHIGLQADDIEPLPDERPQPREQLMLEIGRETVDRAEQIIG